MRLLRPLLPIAAVALLATACGSAATAGGGSSPATSALGPKIHLSPAKMVDRMVLHSGDLLNFAVRSKAVETLKDQLVQPHARNAAEINRVTRAGWLASEHSVIAANPNFPVVSVVNLFRSAARSRKVFAAQLAGKPGALHLTTAPAGSPPGARYATGSQGTHQAYVLTWRQGRVIGLTLMLFRGTPTLSPALRAEIGSLLSRAATAESGRISAALST